MPRRSNVLFASMRSSSLLPYKALTCSGYLKPSLSAAFHSTTMNPGASTTSLLTAAVSNPQSSAAVPEESKGLSHHLKDGKGFVNPWPSYREMSGWAIGRAMIWCALYLLMTSCTILIPQRRKLTGKSNSPDTAPPTVPIRRPSFLSSRQTSTLRATWLGHACYYVEFPGGFRVLFDPVFTPRCSPFSFLGPKRYTEVPCQIDEIPTIDAVIISHNHYDHLSYPTIKKIEEKHPNVQFFAPLGNKKWFTDQGFKNVTEMDWWESKDIRLSKNKQNRSNGSNGAVVTEPNDRSSSGDEPGISANIGCLPCQHTSARTPFDKGQTLWASWSVESGGKKVWFGG